MTSRLLEQKPDPAIKRNILRARRAPPADAAQGWVVAASLAATLAAAALFAQVDAQSATAPAPAATPAAPTVQISVASVVSPAISGLAGLWATLTAGASGDNTAAASSATMDTPAGDTRSRTTVAALATTRSSR